MEASCGEDVDLDSGTVECGVGCGGRAMKYQYWQVSQQCIGGVVQVDFVLRQSQVVGDTNHGGEAVANAWMGDFRISSGQLMGQLHGEEP